MDVMTLHTFSRRIGSFLFVGSFVAAILSPAAGQTEQKVEVTIQDSKFVSTGTTLLPGVPIMVTIVNKDKIRHDFSSVVLQGHLTQVEGNGVITHGQGIEGAYIEGGKDATIRFTTERPGRFEFRCTIHPTMKGELLLMNIGAV
jgi:plastocyanin